MTNPRYSVSIYYQTKSVNGQQLVSSGGVTYSIPTYSPEYFVASMPQIGLWATGSTYQTALSNLLILATASETPVDPPLDTKNYK